MVFKNVSVISVCSGLLVLQHSKLLLIAYSVI